MQRKTSWMLTLAGGLLVCGIGFGGTAEAGPSAAMLSNTCAGCHGTNGVSGGPAMPSIAGMPVEYLNTIMADYKSGERNSTIMGRIAKGYDEKQTALIAGYFSKQKWQNAKSHPNSKLATPVDPAKAKRGKRLAKKCKSCHGKTGIPDEYDDYTPRLAGQWLDYLIFKMQDYKNPDLDVMQPRKMKRGIKKMSAKDLEALAHFYANQQ